jgi:hypothetical protein
LQHLPSRFSELFLPPRLTGSTDFLCRSKRTKKREKVEDKLREALGVPLAIAVPRAKDGTVLAGQNRAPIDDGHWGGGRGEAGGDDGSTSPSSSNETKGDGTVKDKGYPLVRQVSGETELIDSKGVDNERNEVGGPELGKVEPRSRRRNTVTFGTVRDPIVWEDWEGEGKVGSGEGNGRKRGSTVAAPQTREGVRPAPGELVEGEKERVMVGDEVERV